VTESRSVLLFIDEIHTIIGAGGAEGALDASNILKPSLARGELQLIGATTLEEYRKHIEKDAALERRIQPVTVEEPGETESVEILKGLRPYYEKHHKVTITDGALEAAVRMSARYINDRFLPDKAVDLIDEASSRVCLKRFSGKKEPEQAEKEMQSLIAGREDALKRGDLEEARRLNKEQHALQEKLGQEEKRRNSARGRAGQTVTEEDIAATVSSWTKIPLTRLRQSESRRLANLEKVLHKRVVGQDEAVCAVAQAVRRGRAGLKDPGRPIGSFLFLGPTGVGKTELSKALAEAVFGTEDAMIRVDMSEYMEKHSVSKMIGSPPGYVGYEEGGQLSEKIRRHPYSVVLFDEIEKAHPDVFNILLQVLDDGHITDAQGRKVSFRECIIIMTSNTGAEQIVQPKKLGFLSVDDEKQDYQRMKGLVMDELSRNFRPEFLNRIDETIVFHALTKEDMKSIISILLEDLKRRCKEQLNLKLSVTGAARELLIAKSYDSKYGARPLKRAIQKQIEDPLAEEILLGKVHRNSTVTVSEKEGKLVFRERK
jgi:ATP-dependent Clp protease ATP-binding subunit ClpC